jgi:uncharacterized protein
MNLSERITEAMKESMKARDSLRLNAIRLLRSAIKNREIEERRPLDDQAITGVLSSLLKQRRESAQVYRENGRIDLAEREEAEVAILQEFLPAQLSEAEIRAIIDAAVIETGATSMKDMGKVMKIVSGKTLGCADGRVVSDLVKGRLSA